MKRLFSSTRLLFIGILLCISPALRSQSFLIGAPSPAIGASANFSALIQYMLFDVTNPGGVIIDSVDIYPFSAAIGSPFTIVVQNSSSSVIATYNGTTTVSGGSTPQRIKLNFNIPQGTGYRWGFSVNPGMARNSTGGVYPYTVPGLMSITGNTFNVVYYYFFYNIRIAFPNVAADAGISRLIGPADTMCSGQQAVRGMLKNFGAATINSCQLNWTVNGISQASTPWSGNLIAGDSVLVTLGQYNFLSNSTYNVKGWTSLPNNVADLQAANDTSSKSVLLVKPSPIAIPTATSYTICSGDTVTVGGTLTGSPPFNITVFDGFTSQTFSNIPVNFFSQAIWPTSNTTITVTNVTDATGCSYTATPQILITVNPSPTATTTAGGPTTFCMGDSVQLIGFNSPTYAYIWKESGTIIPGSNASTYTAKTSGNYTMTATLGACSRTSSPIAVTAKPLPAFDLGNDTIICAHKSITLSAGSGNSSYLWSTGASTSAIQVDSSGIGLGTKTVFVDVTLNGCSKSDTVRVSFADCTGIEDEPGINSVNIFPNPSSGIIYLSIGTEEEPYQIRVLSVTGQTVYLSDVPEGKNLAELDLSHLRKGVYLLEISSRNQISTKRLVLR